MDIFPPRTVSIVTIFNGVATTLGLYSWNSAHAAISQLPASSSLGLHLPATNHLLIQRPALLLLARLSAPPTHFLGQLPPAPSCSGSH